MHKTQRKHRLSKVQSTNPLINIRASRLCFRPLCSVFCLCSGSCVLCFSKRQSAFTLIEVLAAVFVITIGAGGAFALLQRTVGFTTNAAFQLEASYLAQEGMEIVRNIRDTNLLKIHKGVGGEWTDGLTGCETGCEADYTKDSLDPYDENAFLQFSNGLYSYTAGSNSLYKRKIIIGPPNPPDLDVLLVSVEVTWEERTRSHRVTAATELYNWFPQAPSPTTTQVPAISVPETPSPTTTQAPAISVPVLVLKYFPDENEDGMLDSEITGMSNSLVSIRAKVNQLTTDVVNSLGSGSTYHGFKDGAATPSLQYSVIEDKEFLKRKPVSTNVIPWNPSVFRPDYNFMLTTDVTICNYVDNLGVKEVWVWGYHFGNIEPVESNMAMGSASQVHWNRGTYGDVSNSEQIDDLPTCTQSYTLYNYNYSRGLAEALENHGHHIEATFRFVDATLWNKFQLPHGEPSPTVNSCGWTHTGPNSKEQYEPGWTSESIVKSNCEDWHPDGSGEVKDVDCHTWYGETCLINGGVEFKKWWMQNIPGKDNNLEYQGKLLRNWWEFIGDFDAALKKGKSLTL